MSSPLAGPSNVQPSPPSISGTSPGILDPSQPSRLLRFPGSKLSFASFDPRTAHIGTKDFPDLTKLSLDEQSEHSRPKRIVIETTPQGASFWRFVPRARREEGVGPQDEGFWPRVVEICGEPVHCSQDQWDIYKLDPEYDCFVQSPPKLSIISRIKPKEAATPVPPETPRKRRPPSPSLDIPRRSPRNKPGPRSPSNVSSSGSEQDMSVDDIPRFRSQTATLGRRARKIREQNERNRKARREKIMRFQAKRNRQEDENMFSPPEDIPTTPRPMRFQSMPTESMGKRKAVPRANPSLRSAHNRSRPHPDIQEEEEDDDDQAHKDTNGPAPKRTRTTSPECARKTRSTSRRAEREKGKQQRWGKIMEDRRVDRDQRFMNDILADVPEFLFSDNGATNGSNRNEPVYEDPADESNKSSTSQSHASHSQRPEESQEPEEQHPDDETARRSALAESIRKLQELEKDKPLWDEAAKKRIQRETAEEDERRAKAEERRRAAAWKAELERRAKAEEEERATRARAETERREQDAAAHKRAKQKRQERQRWESGPWTASRALDRYKALCDSFDNSKFSQGEPLTFEDVPWPVLHPPRSFSVEDVDWAAVERFFDAIKPHMRGDEYHGFVEKSHRRFHPDRWRSRRLLTSIVDNGDRECMELAANTVAQALTPLWRKLKEQ